MTDYHAEVRAVRERIAEIQNQRDAVMRAPIPAEEAIQRARAMLVAEPRVLDRLAGSIVSGRKPDMTPDELGALVMTVMAGSIVESLKPRLTKLCAGGLEESERRKRLSILDSQLLKAERQEESLITEARRNGQTIVRRADARPEIVLED